MLSKQYRLRNGDQITDLRQRGRSWQNRWFVLVKGANDCPTSRFAFSVSRRLGKAVIRNRLRRVMRDCIRRRLPTLQSGWDVLLIARLPVRDAPYEQIDGAIADILSQSRLWIKNGDPLWISQAAVGLDQISSVREMRTR